MNTSRLKIRLRIFLVVMGVALGNAGCGGPFGAGRDGNGQESAVRFLQELREGHLEPAWQGTTSEFKSLMGLESLRDCVRSHPALKNPASYVESRDATRDGRPMVEHLFRAEGRVRGKVVASTVKVLVASAGDGSWSVEHLSIE